MRALGGNNKGISLVEILVVLILVAVPTAMALTCYLKWVVQPYAAEATYTLSAWADDIDRCLVTRNDVYACSLQHKPRNTSYFEYTLPSYGQIPGYFLIASYLPGKGPFVWTSMNCLGMKEGKDVFGQIGLCYDSIHQTRTLIKKGLLKALF